MEFINVRNINQAVDTSLNTKNKLNNSKHSNFVDFINASNKILKPLQSKDIPQEVKTSLNTVQILLNMTINDTNYKTNGKLDILGILKTHGNKLSDNDTKEFKDNLMTLLNQGLIESHDYFEAVKLISIKSNFKNISDKCEEKIVKEISELDPKSEYK